MKKILTLFTILVLTACTEVTYNNYNFIGESEHWEAEYIYNGTETWGDNNGTKTYSNKDSGEFVLKYKGSLEELSSMRYLKYSYKTNSRSGGAERGFDESPKEKIFKHGGGSSSGGAGVSEDEVIHVYVKWDKFEESFELHNENK